LVLIQSGSRNKPGLDRMAEAVAAAMPDGMRLEFLPFAEHGTMLMAKSPKAAAGDRQLLLLGHTDTVFPEDTDFNHYHEDEHKVYGPGVIDMKGGLVCGIYALAALAGFGLLDQIPVCMFCNSDEEIGSPASWDIISREADRSFAAFVMECGGENGEIVTGRKGRSGYRLTVQGRSGHAAQAGLDKASAIVELAHKIIAMEKLNDPPALSLNVGSIKGGIGPNTVPGHAEAHIDIRFVADADEKRVKTVLDRIVGTPSVAGTACTLDFQTGRPPMPQTGLNKALFDRVRSQAMLLGQNVNPEFRHGVSDANVVASRGVPVLDGMGPMGNHDHSEQEYMLKSSLVSRSALLALSIWHCSV
jgi:glutamate carboxypeptidase